MFVFVLLASDSCLIAQPQFWSFDWLGNTFVNNMIKDDKQNWSHYMFQCVLFLGVIWSSISLLATETKQFAF